VSRAAPPDKDSTIVVLPGDNPADSSRTLVTRHGSEAGIRGTMLHLWFARKAALEIPDVVEAQARVEELRVYMGQEGISADRAIARGFAYEGYENLREGNYERAREAFDLARSFDPFLPQAQFGYAWSLLRAGRGVFTFVNEYIKGIKLSWRQFTTDEILISNFGVVVTFALFTTLMIVSLFVIARCQARVRHDIFEFIRRILPDRGARVTAWAVFLLPLLIWAGGLWLVLFWLALCFRHMRLPEKGVAIVVFLMIGLSPLGIRIVLDRFESSTDPEMQIVMDAIHQGYNPATLEKLKHVVDEHPEAPELSLLLGAVYAKGDLQGEAYDAYRRVIEMRPSNTAALINVGNVYYRLGEFAQAVNRYKQALQIQPDLVSAYWNLYLAQTELLHFSEAESSLARARELDGQRIGEMLAGKKDAGMAQLFYESTKLSRIKEELRGGGFNARSATDALFNPISFASGAGLVFALILSIGSRGRTAEACVRCGRAYCQSCHYNASDQEYCPRCVHLFLKKDEIKVDVRSDELGRLHRIDSIKAITRRLLSLVLPGSGQILSGRAVVGVPLMMSWIVVGMCVLSRERLLLSARVPVSDLPPAELMLGISLMALVWIVANTVPTSMRFSTGDDRGA
jgi:tetratricopeptide (TPR) repeat protein